MMPTLRVALSRSARLCAGRWIETSEKGCHVSTARSARLCAGRWIETSEGRIRVLVTKVPPGCALGGGLKLKRMLIGHAGVWFRPAVRWAVD